MSKKAVTVVLEYAAAWDPFLPTDAGLSSHSCFGKYLQSVGHHCVFSEDSTQQNSCLGYAAWSPTAVIGGDLPLPVIRSKAGSDSSFTVVAMFCEEVVLQKLAAERAREDDLFTDTFRRWRTERRRLVYQRLMPPQCGQGWTGWV